MVKRRVAGEASPIAVYAVGQVSGPWMQMATNQLRKLDTMVFKHDRAVTVIHYLMKWKMFE